MIFAILSFIKIRALWLSLAFFITFATAVGFYARKRIKESQYKHHIKKSKNEWVLCVERAISPSDYQLCYEKIKPRGVKK